MVFSSSVFLLRFLPVVLIGNGIIAGFLKKNSLSNLWLLAASLVFYAWGEPFYVLLMMGSVAANWLGGWLIAGVKGRTKNVLLILGILGNLGILGYYKYAGFFVRILNTFMGGDILPVPQTVLPIGISFFTFQAMSYIVDVYRGNVKASKNPVNVALYISFFPQLIAGPIVKYRDIHEQIASRRMTWAGVADGFRRFIYGLAKKVLVANVLGLCVDKIYDLGVATVDGKTAWIAALSYTFQIYYDFSGYSDMAIGLGQMFGFCIPENFRYPYLSHSITEFWRRWHISLGAWFREYVYIPLGGNRKGKGRTYLHLLIVFFLTGLWHGADMAFVLWGLYHGMIIVMERAFLAKWQDKHNVLSAVLTFLAVNIGWVLFRAADIRTGLTLIGRMLIPSGQPVEGIPSWQYMDAKTVAGFIAAILGMGILQKVIPGRIREAWKGSAAEALYCAALLIFCLAAVASDTYNPFIYFQF